MEIFIHNQNAFNSVQFYLKPEIYNQLINKEIVVSYTEDSIKFREAMIDDKNTRTLTKVPKQKAYICSTKIDNKSDFIGKWSVVKDGDWFILDEKIK